ncbi:hypothetical protein AJ80_09971 [Polytolypa hystricis UAMH7299]|uniref:CAP-Gly domain-containing protein n=1 Tax=Polytolypa hystricis (strain UAMH7299) TaxID=1447883 RepID=A0A2B7WFN9_POLH7|nr:hypothetical protein AJ80_09971 [Polytolypa hystricis UAMH7299]
MAPHDDIQVGDLVNVPGGMYGTIRFVGTVAGKPGRFAGVELAPEHAGRGKNNGDVEGRNYFTTSISGSGIFVPINNSKYVTRRVTSRGGSAGSGSGGRIGTPPTPQKSSAPNFSKSVGPGVPMSVNRPKFARRPSLPRPDSPQRSLVSPPKLNMGGLRTPSGFSKGSPVNGVPKTPLRASRPASRPVSRLSMEDTPGSVRRADTRASAYDDQEAAERVRFLERQLRDRDKQLDELASTLAEFQKSITELEGSDAIQVRGQLREKNEKIAALTAEFDSHRADFRSTLDTLEVAASETERVYEKRIEELMQANRELQDGREDVEQVARQLKQLEELVSELEEGLEDARRGEAEARGEVEFLRGEVERTRLELKQEKEKSAAAFKGADGMISGGASLKDLDQKDDEIRGLKAIIHSLSRGEPSVQPLNHSKASDPQDTERISRLEHQIQDLEGLSERKTFRIEELERELQKSPQTNNRARGGTITSLRPQHQQQQPIPSQAAASNNAPAPTPNHAHTLSDRTVVPNDWHDAPAQLFGNNPAPPSNGQFAHFSPPHHNIRTDPHHRQLESMQEDSHSSSTDEGSALWCEICETSGHDILTCTNMFGVGAGGNATAAPNNASNNNNGINGTSQQQQPPYSAPTNGMKPLGGSPSSQRTGRDVVLEGLKGIGGLSSSSMAPAAGKTSGIIDETKWCALCERDGHESIDCPFDE